MRGSRQPSAISHQPSVTADYSDRRRKHSLRFAGPMIVRLVAHALWVQAQMEITCAAVHLALVRSNLASNSKETETLFTSARNHSEAKATTKIQHFLTFPSHIKLGPSPEKTSD